ncbi:helix-turn-helix transcriptional regulator [Halobacteriaceae archaeon GCM10025711]
MAAIRIAQPRGGESTDNHTAQPSTGGFDDPPTEPDRLPEQTDAVEEPPADEDYVLRLLIKNDGRIRQSALVDETGWSKDHVDEVLSEMQADRQITTLPSGGENVIYRRGYEPEGKRPLF